MKLFSLLFLLAFGITILVSAQNDQEDFKIEIELKHTAVISQGSTGTCWSFATTSFLESEILRKGFPETDLSEMYFVNFAYENKAKMYLLYHGNNNFSQGGQAHDVFDVVREFGIVTNESYPGIKTDGRFRHGDLVNQLNQEITGLNKKREDFDVREIKLIDSILNEHIGKIPIKIKTGEENYSPVEFQKKFKINPDDYVELTSYNHHPFYAPFVLEIPDNWSHALYYNLPIN